MTIDVIAQYGDWKTSKPVEEEIYNAIYNKAIDDFVEYANTMPTVESEDGEIRPMWLEEIAERLKGEKNGY